MIKAYPIDVTILIMLNDGIFIGSIVAVNVHENHTISHFVFTVCIDYRLVGGWFGSNTESAIWLIGCIHLNFIK